ncbi:MAG: hypothetical protein ABI137_13370 [Antricoccus sp.]
MSTENIAPETDHAPAAPTYDAHQIQEKWLAIWDKIEPFQVRDDGTERRYMLDMFAYPSGICIWGMPRSSRSAT